MNKTVIKIIDVIKKDEGLNKHDGEIIHNIIATNIKKQIKSVVDFSGLTVIPSFFINYAIGQLYNEYTTEILNTYVAFNTDKLNATQISQIKIAMDIARTQLSSDDLDADER